MAKKKSRKKKRETIYQEVSEESKESKDRYNKKIQDEITELERKKSEIQKGFKGKLIKIGINRAINERKGILNAERRTVLAERNTKQLNALIRQEEARSRLKELKKKNQVNFNDLMSTGNLSSPNKNVKFEDLF